VGCARYVVLRFSKENRSMFALPFTQYLLPNGDKKEIEFIVDGDTEIKAKSILKYGWVFEAEILTNGVVSLTISDGEEDRVIQVCENGTTIPIVIEKLIDEGDIECRKELRIEEKRKTEGSAEK